MHRRFVLTTVPLLGLAACETAPATSEVAVAAASPPPAPTTIVFFTADSAALDDNARQIVAQAAAVAQARPGQSVRVRGFAAPDKAPNRSFGKALANARAQHVADHLVELGVDRGRIRIESRGTVPFESFATEARRVEILTTP